MEKANPKTPAFREKSFVAEMFELMDGGEYIPAELKLIDALPKLQAAGINRKEKINDIQFLSRMLQFGGRTKHGYPKLRNKIKGLIHNIGEERIVPKGAFVDLGCGAHDPIGLATFHYVNGFDQAYAIDLLSPRNERYSALSMYDILTNMIVFPERYTLTGVDPQTVAERARRFDLEAFERGDFWGGIAPVKDDLRYEQCDIVDSSLEPGTAGLLCSFAVLEHVSDIDGVCKKIFDALLPGAVAFHFIDLADHRAYRAGGEFHELSFLAEQEAPKNINRLRASEHLAAQERTGFEILSSAATQIDMPDDIRQNLLPQFKEMDEEDVTTIRLNVVVRKPT